MALCVCVVGVMDVEPVCGGNFKGCDLTYERNLNNLFCKNLLKLNEKYVAIKLS